MTRVLGHHPCHVRHSTARSVVRRVHTRARRYRALYRDREATHARCARLGLQCRVESMHRGRLQSQVDAAQQLHLPVLVGGVRRCLTCAGQPLHPCPTAQALRPPMPYQRTPEATS